MNDNDADKDYATIFAAISNRKLKNMYIDTCADSTMVTIQDDDEIESWDEDDWDGDDWEDDADWYEDEERGYNYESMLRDVLEELIKQGKADFIILKHDELRHWWSKVQTIERRKQEAQERRAEAKRKKEEDKQAKADLLARLTPEEKRLLGIK